MPHMLGVLALLLGGAAASPTVVGSSIAGVGHSPHPDDEGGSVEMADRQEALLLQVGGGRLGGLTEEEIALLMAMLDDDGNGELTAHEMYLPNRFLPAGGAFVLAPNRRSFFAPGWTCSMVWTTTRS